eukprot:jgi/Chrzof1/8566/Cz03g15260.t1
MFTFDCDLIRGSEVLLCPLLCALEVVWVESHVVRGAGGLNRSPDSSSPPPGHDTHTLVASSHSAMIAHAA